MPTEDSTKSRKTSTAAPPFLLSLFLVLLLAGCALYIWRDHSARLAERQAQIMAEEESRTALLTTERERLEHWLRLSPCEAKGYLENNVQTPVPTFTPENTTPGKEAPGAEATVSHLEQACVFIVSADDKSGLNTGSGFFVAPGHVATNRHVIAEAKGRILVTNKAMPRPVFGEVIAAAGGERDYAVLRVDLPEGTTISPLAFAAQANRTEKVGAWGFPKVIGQNDPAYAKLLNGEDIAAVPELSYTEGVISAILDRTPPVIVHTAPISPGNSGGPLVNASGDIVGINTMITLDEDSYRQASISLSGRDLLLFLKENGIAVQSR